MEDHPRLACLAGILNNYLEPQVQARLTGEANSDIDLSWCDKLPSPQWCDIASEIAESSKHTLQNHAYVSFGARSGTSPNACHLYMGHGRILIRPFIPPTDTHLPFANARQRVTPATLGEGGELKRIFGRRHIKRLEIPKGWNKQGIGRSLLTFPRAISRPRSRERLSLTMMKEAGR